VPSSSTLTFELVISTDDDCVVLFVAGDKPPSLCPQLYESGHLWIHVGQVSSQSQACLASVLLLLLILHLLRPRNDLLCVDWDVKLHTLSDSGDTVRCCLEEFRGECGPDIPSRIFFNKINQADQKIRLIFGLSNFVANFNFRLIYD